MTMLEQKQAAEGVSEDDGCEDDAEDEKNVKSRRFVVSRCGQNDV